MDLSLKEQYLKDMEIIKTELKPFLVSLEENEVDMFSVAMFFSSYVKELLKEIGSKSKREIIVKNMLDENYD